MIRPLSDGADPPKGLLPAYIIRVILARKLEIELELKPASVQPDVSQPAVLGVPVVADFRPFDLRLAATVAGADDEGFLSLDAATLPGTAVSVFPVPPVFRPGPILKERAPDLVQTLSQTQPGPDDVFVLAFVCQKLPKLPDPDQNLFRTGKKKVHRKPRKGPKPKKKPRPHD